MDALLYYMYPLSIIEHMSDKEFVRLWTSDETRNWYCLNDTLERLNKRAIKLGLEPRDTRKTWPKNLSFNYPKPKFKVRFVGISSVRAAYAVYKEDGSILGYSDTLGKIDYDVDGRVTMLFSDCELDIIDVDESGWD
jgi:hypothetical protein